jgi:anti-anti-sigma factor
MIEVKLYTHETLELIPIGDLDWIGSLSLRQVVDSAIQPGMKVVLDMKKVGNVDAVAQSALAGIIRRVRRVNGEIEIANMPQEVERVLTRSGVYHLLRYCQPTTDDAA